MKTIKMNWFIEMLGVVEKAIQTSNISDEFLLYTRGVNEQEGLLEPLNSFFLGWCHSNFYFIFSEINQESFSLQIWNTGNFKEFSFGIFIDRSDIVGPISSPLFLSPFGAYGVKIMLRAKEIQRWKEREQQKAAKGRRNFHSS